jgi:hypothetical protein
MILSLGSKFALQDSVPLLKLIANVETVINSLDIKPSNYLNQDEVLKAKENRDKSIVKRSNCINHISNYLQTNRGSLMLINF